MKRLVVGIFVVGMVVRCQGLVVAGWDVAGVDVDDGFGVESNIPPYTFYSTTSDSVNVSAALTLGNGVLRSTSTNQYGFKISGALQTNSLAGAIAQDQFMEIFITIDEGYELNLDSIEMKGQSSEQTGCSNVVLMTSIDGYVAGNQIASATNANTTGGFDTDDSGFGQPIDLTTNKYQNLTGSVSFRLYGWNSSAGTGATYIRNLMGDDLVVFGEVIEVGGAGDLLLNLETSNDWILVGVEFDGTAPTNYVLQTSTNMVSNVWNTVSGTFNADTNWNFGATNRFRFFRVIEQ